MRLPAIALTTLLATTLAMPSIVCADEQSDKQVIMKAYSAQDVAFERKNVNQIYADFAPEFTSIDQNGKLTNLEQERQQTQNNFKNIRQIKAHNEIKQIQINGQTATVMGTSYISAIGSNLNNPQIPVPFSNVSQYQDIWKRTNSGWKLISTHFIQSNVSTQQASQGNPKNLTRAQQEALFQMQLGELKQVIQNGYTYQKTLNCLRVHGRNC